MNGSRLFNAITAQALVEMKLTLRRGESVLVTLIIPAALLVFFASGKVLAAGNRSIAFLLPGTLALAVLSTGMVSLGIATAYERHYGVLKWFGATPMPRRGLIVGKMFAVLLVEAVQVVLLVLLAVAAYDWRPHGSVFMAVIALLLGTICFSGMAMTMAGALRAETTLALANALFILFLLLGGLFVPLENLPGWIVPIAKLLPAAALADVLRSVLKAGTPVPLMSSIVLGCWTVATPVAAALLFRWE